MYLMLKQHLVNIPTIQQKFSPYENLFTVLNFLARHIKPVHLIFFDFISTTFSHSVQQSSRLFMSEIVSSVFKYPP